MNVYSGTAVGVATSKGVILASDKRYVYGSFVVSGGVKKTFVISDRVGVAAAGVAGDIQELFKEVSYLVRLREIRLGKRMNVRSIAKLTSVLMYNRKLVPFLTQILIGGYVDRPELYSLDSIGSVIEDKYIVLGTGAEIAIGVIESNYSSDLSLDEAKELVLSSLKSVAKRDVLSGREIDIIMVDENGVAEDTVSLSE
jgi:proteasome beta subunit